MNFPPFTKKNGMTSVSVLYIMGWPQSVCRTSCSLRQRCHVTCSSRGEKNL